MAGVPIPDMFTADLAVVEAEVGVESKEPGEIRLCMIMCG